MVHSFHSWLQFSKTNLKFERGVCLGDFLTDLFKSRDLDLDAYNFLDTSFMLGCGCNVQRYWSVNVWLVLMDFFEEAIVEDDVFLSEMYEEALFELCQASKVEIYAYQDFFIDPQETLDSFLKRLFFCFAAEDKYFLESSALTMQSVLGGFFTSVLFGDSHGNLPLAILRNLVLVIERRKKWEDVLSYLENLPDL